MKGNAGFKEIGSILGYIQVLGVIVPLFVIIFAFQLNPVSIPLTLSNFDAGVMINAFISIFMQLYGNIFVVIISLIVHLFIAAFGFLALRHVVELDSVRSALVAIIVLFFQIILLVPTDFV